jgi:hypothetical protein
MEAVEIARFIRNLSADTIMVGASLVSGGAALALAGTGSVAKGAATYQDTGKVGAAVIKATGSFALAVIPIKAPGGSLDKPAYLILGSGIVDGSTSFAAGGDLRQALAAGGAAMLQESPVVSGVLTKGLTDKVPIPVRLVVGQAALSRSAEDLAQDRLGRVLQKRKSKIKIALPENSLVRQTPDVPQLLARLAILDTDPRRGLLRQI